MTSLCEPMYRVGLVKHSSSTLVTIVPDTIYDDNKTRLKVVGCPVALRATDAGALISALEQQYQGRYSY